MIGFIKFGLNKSGALFPICEVLLLIDLLILILRLGNVWAWIGFIGLIGYNILLVIEYLKQSYGERRVQ